ncbi:MAG: nuclear transport factor 2 family protein [Limimaricola sp.]|uniref:nuclear transport factor 2 family protein n=1 Tax=Limimaricola sp. TaxID=2211665 RepID=UPI001D895945|nr:nuclear transport factor 2 family protein [Limimaricola sp.]MBI1416979.1 nuclear transport factor 2 family protein [Limimaricola sp.]
MHPTIAAFEAAAQTGDEAALAPLLSPVVQFLPPTYWARWQGPEAVAAVLGHVGQVFTDFRYRRVMGHGPDWALEFQCKVGDLDAVGVDLITLDADGLIAQLEVVMRPLKTVAALREAMNARVATDPRFLKLRDALTDG